jgi:capsular exopolysaccharide synthesis family protein
MKYQETNVIPDLGATTSPLGHAAGTDGQSYQTPFVVGGSRQSPFRTFESTAEKSEPEGAGSGTQEIQSHREHSSAERQKPQSNLEIIGKVLGAVRRQFWLVAILSVLLSTLAVGVVLILPPQFTATALLAVDGSDERAPGPSVSGYTLNVDGEVEVMQSMKVAQQVVRRLNLTEDSRFVDKPSSSPSSTGGISDYLKKFLPAPGDSSVKQIEATTLGSKQTTDTSADDDPAVTRAAVALQKITNVRRRGLTSVVALDITIDDPKDAARLANAYADTYISEQISAKLSAAEHAETALSRRVTDLGEELRRSESQIKAFALVQGSQSNDDAPRRGIDRLQANIAAASREAGLQAAKLRDADSLLASGNYAALGKLLETPEIVVLDEQRRSLEQRVQRPSEDEADLSGLWQRLDLTNSQLRSIGSKHVESLRRQSEASGRQVSTLRQELKQVVQESDLSTDNSVQLFRLQQEAATTRQLYQEYLGRLKAAAQQRNTVAPTVYVVAEAGIPPNRSFPPRSLLAVIGGLAAIALAVGVGYARDNHPENIKFVDELEVASRAPNVGAIPDARRAKTKELLPENLICARPLSCYSEAIRRLRISMQLTFNRGAGFKSLLVTSTQRREGRTTIALSLARDAARAGLKVVLLDCDLRNPSLHSKLGISNAEGITEMLLSPAPVVMMSKIQMDTQSSCFVIPSGELEDASPDQPLQSPQLGGVIKELGERFDLVVIDAASIETGADALMIAQHVDGVLLIARSTQSRPAKVRDAVLDFRRTRSGNLATVLNFAAQHDL